MWKKFLGAEKRKIDKDAKATIWEELQLQEKHNLDFSAIWKLSSNDLCEALRKYENYSLQLRKDYKSISDERDLYKKKFSSAVEERNKLADEREEIEQNEQNLRELYHSESNKTAGLMKQIAILEGQIVSFKNKLHDFSMHQGLDDKDGVGGGDKDNLVSSDQPEQLSTSLLQELQGQSNNILDNNLGQNSKNAHNSKNSKHGISTTTRILLNPDSQLMLFVTEKELQNLRDIFDNTVAALSLKYPGLARQCHFNNENLSHSSSNKNAIMNHFDQEINKHKDSDDITSNNGNKGTSSLQDYHTSPMLKVYVGNLGSETDESQITEFFNSIAQVEAVNLPLNNLGETKGYAVVEFANNVELGSVVKHGKGQLLNGRRLKIMEFNNQGFDIENDASNNNNNDGSENEQRDSEIGEARESVQIRQHSSDEDEQQLPEQQAIKKKSQSLKAYVSAVVDKKKTINKQGSGDYQAVQGKQRFQGISKETKTKEQQQQQQFYQQFSSSDAELLTEVQHNWKKLNKGLDQLQLSISKLQPINKNDQLIKDKDKQISQLQMELSSEKNDKNKLLSLNSEIQIDMISLTAEKTALAKTMAEEIALKEDVIKQERNTHMLNMQASSQQILQLSQQIEDLQRRILESQVALQEKEKQMQWQQSQQVNLNNQVIGNQQGVQAKEIMDLEKQLQEQRAKVEKGQIHLSTVTQELTLSKQELNKVNVEVNSLKVKLQQMNQELEVKTTNLSQLVTENKTLKGQLENLNKEIIIVNKNIEKISGECKLKGEEIINYQRQLRENEVLTQDRIDKVAREKQELNQVIEKMKEELENVKKEKDNMNNQKEDIFEEDMVVVVKGNGDNKEIQREELDKQSYGNKDNLELQQALECQQRLEEELADIVRQREQLQGQLEKQLAEMVRITQELANKIEENRQICETIQVKELQIIEKDKIIAAKEQSLKDIVIKCNQLEESVSKAQTESQINNNAEIQGQLEDVQQKHDELNKKYQDLLEQLNAQTKEQQVRTIEESERYNEVANENISLKEQHRDQLKELEEKLQESMRDIEDYKRQLSQLEEEKNKIQEKYNEIQGTYEKLEEEMRQLKDNYLKEKVLENDQMIKEKVEEEQGEQRKLKVLQSEFEGKINDLQRDQQQQIEELRNQHRVTLEERLEQGNQEYLNSLEDKNEVIKEKMMEIEGLKEQMEKIKEDQNKKDQIGQESMTLLVEKMRQELIQEKEREIGQMNEQIKIKEEEIAKINGELETLIAEQKEKEIQNNVFIQSLQDKQREEQDTSVKKISELMQQQYQQLSLELLKQQDQYEEKRKFDEDENQKKFQEINVQLQESLTNANILEEQLKEQSRQYEEDIKKATEVIQNVEIERLNNQIDEINKQMIDKDNESKDLQILLKDLQNKLDNKEVESQKQLEESQKIINQNQVINMDEFERADWQNRVHQLNEEIASLNQEISNSAVRIEELLAQSTMNQKDIMSYQDNMNQLKEQNNILEQQIIGLKQQLNDSIAIQQQQQTQFEQNNLKNYTKETTMQTDMLQTKQAVNSPSHEEFKKLLTKTASLIDQRHTGLSQNLRKILRNNSVGFPQGHNNGGQKYIQDSITMNIQLVNPRREKRALNIIRKELEALYKTYVTLAFNLKLPSDSPYSQEFLHFEKKINRINQKVQECIDYIDEQAEKETRQQKTTNTTIASSSQKPK